MPDSLFKAYQRSAQAGIDEAQCLPFEVYHNPQIHQLETEKVFHNDWIFACAEDKLQKAGDYFAFDLAGEQIALIKAKDGSLNALSNICRHRGTPLLNLGFGKIEKNIVCPYHAWTYDDKGELLGLPFQGNCQLNKEEHSLPSFHLHIWQGLIFINLAPNPLAFGDKISHLEKYLAAFELERFKYSYQTKTENWQANWKLAVENGIESYHLFKVHKHTLEQVTPTKQAYYVAGSARSSLTGGEMKGVSSTLTKWFASDSQQVYNHYLLLFLPPSFVAIISYQGFDWVQILPTSEQTCSVTPGGLSTSAVKNLKSAEFQFSDEFMAEDKAICERLQRGMLSTKSSGGKLVEMERVVADFHQYLANKLFNSGIDNLVETEHGKMFLR